MRRQVLRVMLERGRAAMPKPAGICNPMISAHDTDERVVMHGRVATEYMISRPDGGMAKTCEPLVE